MHWMFVLVTIEVTESNIACFIHICAILASEQCVQSLHLNINKGCLQPYQIGYRHCLHMFKIKLSFVVVVLRTMVYLLGKQVIYRAGVL